MKRSVLFNEFGNDLVSTRSIIKGNITGLFNLNEVKYHWAKPMYTMMIGNFWVPEKVKDLDKDAIMYPKLSSKEQKAYKGILSFLIFLDSIQTVNIPHLSDYITSPEVKLLLSLQSYQEAIHSQSYTTMLETVVEAKEREEIYYFWKTDKVLLERNKYIGSIYQTFLDHPNEKNFFKALVGNYILEGLYFYNGFAFFDTLGSHSKMKASQRMISYIRRDELSHVVLFANIIKAIRKEFPKIYSEEVIHTMLSEAVEQEIQWTKHILGNSIDGITNKDTEKYTKFLANERLRFLKLAPLYPEVIISPYKHLEAMSEVNGEKVNFFESTVIDYTQSSSMNGSWDF